MRLLSRLLVISFITTANFSAAAEPSPHRKITGVYRIYGGELVDSVAPTVGDRKIMFSVDSKIAREIFDAIGPDVKDACTELGKDRVRKKDNENLVCVRTEKGKYFCNFGFDLRTGKSIGGIAC